MDNKTIVLGSGKLAAEILSQVNWDNASRKKDGFDFNRTEWYDIFDTHETIVNCIADTDTYGDNKDNIFDTNYISVMNLVDHCSKTQKKIVQISSDYVYANSIENALETDISIPAHTWYSLSKLLADEYIQARSKDYLIVRTSFKQTPFPYDEAIVTQVGNFDYIDVIAELIIKLIKKNAHGVFNVGTKKKTIYDLATQTKPEVIAAFWKVNKLMPNNITMNVSKMENFFK